MKSAVVILYEDLNCPFCYALTTLLREAKLEHLVGWRGIEHAPRAKVPWKPPSEAMRHVIDSEISMVKERCPRLPLRSPVGQPNTRLALISVTDAFRRDPQAGCDLRARLKHALFVDNIDISDPDLIEHHRKELGLSSVWGIADLESDLARWRAEWVKGSPRMLPTLVLPNGHRRPGLGTPAEAIEFVREHAGA